MKSLNLRDIHEGMRLSEADARRFKLYRTADKLRDTRAELGRFLDCAPLERKVAAERVLTKLKEVERTQAKETDVEPAGGPPASLTLTILGIWGGLLYTAGQISSDMEQMKKGAVLLAAVGLATGLSIVSAMVAGDLQSRFSLPVNLEKIRRNVHACRQQMEDENETLGG
jgi:hypothetical protein